MDKMVRLCEKGNDSHYLERHDKRLHLNLSEENAFERELCLNNPDIKFLYRRMVGCSYPH